MSRVISRDNIEQLNQWVNSGEQGGETLVSQATPLLTAQQIEEIQEEARKEGYKIGHAEGLAAGKNEAKQRVTRLEQVFNSLQAPLAQLDEDVEAELVTLAMAIAKQIIRRELKIEPEHVIAAIREAVGTLPLSSRNIQVLLHPEDAKVVRESLSVNESDEGWKIIDSPQVARGGCRIVTDTSTVDATLERRLAAIAAQVFGGERSTDEMLAMDVDDG